MPTPWRHPRTGGWYLRLDVPKELQPIVGKTSFRESLHTKNQAEAKLRFPAALAKAQAALQRAREALADGDARRGEDLFWNWVHKVSASETRLDQVIEAIGMGMVAREVNAAFEKLARERDPALGDRIDDMLAQVSSDDDLEALQKIHGFGLATRMPDGRLLPHVQVGYPFLAGDDLKNYVTRILAFDSRRQRAESSAASSRRTS